MSLTVGQLPESLPLLSVKDVLLLPAGKVSLSFDEPNDIGLILDVLRSPLRMMGVVLEHPEPSKQSSNIGCAGRITAFEEHAHGVIEATITGYIRFLIHEELTSLRKYRMVKPGWSEYTQDLSVEISPLLDREYCIDLLKSYVDILGVAMDWAVLDQVPNMSLINFFAMCLPFAQDQRQRLLEAPTLADRGAVLIQLLQEQLASEGGPHDTSQ